MLHQNSSDSHIGAKKGLDVILKHKIRNLRAKLKTLLSSESCTKYSKRQKQVKKIQQLQNKQFHLTNMFFNQNKQLFTHSKQQPKQLWYSDKQKCNVMNVFGRLTKQEIQQISEDMIYYLGEDNVSKFKEFLQLKSTIKQKNKENFDHPIRRLKTSKQENPDSQRKFEDKKQSQTDRKDSYLDKFPKFNKNCSIGQNFFGGFRNSIQSNQSYSNNFSSKRLKTANLIQSRCSTITKRSTQKQRLKFQANYLGNRQNFLKNRRMIEQQQNAQRLLTKITLNMKQQKAIDVFKMTQQAFLTTIKQKNTENDHKTKRILEDKYKKNVTFGSIVEMNQQLRKIFIKKISQGAPPQFSSFAPQQKFKDKKKYDTTLSNFFSQSNSHYKSKY